MYENHRLPDRTNYDILVYSGDWAIALLIESDVVYDFGYLPNWLAVYSYLGLYSICML
jgi:hypothetical protein